MKQIGLTALTVLYFTFSTAFDQKKITLSSPGGKIIFVLTQNKGTPEYAVMFNGKTIVDHSALGFNVKDRGDVLKNSKIGRVIPRSGEDNYVLTAGKTSKVHDFYNEVTIPFTGARRGASMLVNLKVRAFDDGLAFRYELPKQENLNGYTLLDEVSSFNLQGNPKSRLAYLENFTTSHEHRYTVAPYNSMHEDSLIEVPALFEYPGDVFLAITEANLVDYAGMSLIKQQGTLKAALSPLPKQTAIKVKAVLPHHSPWRVLILADRVGALIESNILTNLSEPCKIKDVSWLKPGKSSFHWWNGDVMPDTTFEPGINFEFNKYYIDFCARNQIEYHTVIGYRGIAWYQNDGIEYQPGPHTDVTTPRPGLDIQQICDYAKSKGVGIRFWVHWKALYPKIDSAFTLFEKWGIKGMMVDFMDRDDQEMVRIQERILSKAAEHHLEIQFHGAFKPTGLSRTYPNESTREGTLNYENNKGGNLITPDDDINIPFTRLLAGPTDYHLGGFRAMPASKFHVLYTRPHMLGTRCHMLAMYVILENHLSMVCDYPEAYEGQPGFDFLKEVPTVWDETKVIGAQAGEWIAIARRKGNDWYLGSITNGQERTVTLLMDFLPGGLYHASIYSDASDSFENPNHLSLVKRDITANDRLKIHFTGGGGQVVKLTRST